MSASVLPMGFAANYSSLRSVSSAVHRAATLSEGAPAALPRQAVHSVRRNLFGPIDHEATKRFVHEELGRIANADKRRWNFDFEVESPMDGRFSWCRVKANAVPPAYAMPNLSSRLAILRTNGRARVQETDSLSSALNNVTTATTTVPAAKKSHEKTSDLKTEKSEEVPSTNSQLNKTNNAKQTYITDFMRICKRSRSIDGEMSKSSLPPPSKRARSSEPTFGSPTTTTTEPQTTSA